jgi:hypothetical protein
VAVPTQHGHTGGQIAVKEPGQPDHEQGPARVNGRLHLGTVTWLRVLISAAVVWPRARLRGKDSVEERAGFGAGRAVADLVGAEKAHLTTPCSWNITLIRRFAVRAFAEDAAQILDDSPGR